MRRYFDIVGNSEIFRSAMLLAALLAGHPTFAAVPAGAATSAAASSAPSSDATRHPYYGELHLHTTYSFDANASSGLMYGRNDSDGRAIDQAYAERRILNKPVSETSQNKGQSETHPLLSPTDEFANFEIFDTLLVSKEPSDPHGSYVRDAYGRGLLIGQRIGVNPYKFGVVVGGDPRFGTRRKE